MHRTVSRLSVHLNFHVYILFVVVFTLVGQLVAGNDLLVCSRQLVISWRLVVAGYYYHYCLSDNQWWQWAKVGGAGKLLLGWLTDRDG